MLKKYLVEKWEYLRGSISEFSFENRMTNSICVITFLLVVLLMCFNMVMSLYEEAFICMVILGVIVYVYYQSRFRKKYRSSIVIYAITCYLALIFAFYYNSGIDGPIIMIFFLTFHVLISVTPRKQHGLWAILHVLVAGTLCAAQYYVPGLITNTYPNERSRYIDMIFTYSVSLLFIYFLTIHLRNNLDRIRKRSQERAAEIEAHLEEIRSHNEKLKEISWLQSHKVRSQVATILGLSQFVDQSSIEDPDMNRIIGGIKEAAKDLDDVIREINRLTNSVDINK